MKTKNIRRVKFSDAQKILRLIRDFKSFDTITELETVVYLSMHIGEPFDYDKSEFTVGLDGASGKSILWDLWDLKSRFNLISLGESVKITDEGNSYIERELQRINFQELKTKLDKAGKDMWPKIAAYFYTVEYNKGDLEKTLKDLETGFEISTEESKRIHEFVSSL